MRPIVRLVSVLLVSSCGSASDVPPRGVDGGNGAAKLTLSLTRDPTQTPNPVQIMVRLEAPAGTPAPGRAVHVTAAGEPLAVQDRTDGTYAAVYMPSAPSAEVPITAAVDELSLTAMRTALVLPLVSSDWNQPEMVPGLVNTPGYEDSEEVSPDGEWLIVSSYSPVDPRCLFAGQSPTSGPCQSVIGPYDAPERPGMLGADRIVSPTEVRNRCDPLCVTIPNGPDANVAIPPVAAYGFRRQPDDSFGEPFVIGFGADGYSFTAYGFDFVAAPSDNAADLIFAKRPVDTYNEAYLVHATLGAPVELANYACVNGVPKESEPIYAKPSFADPPGTSHGNPCLRGGYLWFDDENVNPHTISVAPATGSPASATVGASAPVPIANPTAEARVQPFFDGGRLYFGASSTNGVASADLHGDPKQAASWSAERPELGGEGIGVVAMPGRVAGIGEPSIAHPTSGPARLYFVYVIARDGGRVDWNIGRVDHF